jgi:hypothetical protein
MDTARNHREQMLASVDGGPMIKGQKDRDGSDTMLFVEFSG